MNQDSSLSERDELEGENTPLLQPTVEESIGIAGIDRSTTSTIPSPSSNALPPLSKLSINTELDTSKDDIIQPQTPNESFAERLQRLKKKKEKSSLEENQALLSDPNSIAAPSPRASFTQDKLNMYKKMLQTRKQRSEEESKRHQELEKQMISEDDTNVDEDDDDEEDDEDYYPSQNKDILTSNLLEGIEFPTRNYMSALSTDDLKKSRKLRQRLISQRVLSPSLIPSLTLPRLRSKKRLKFFRNELLINSKRFIHRSYQSNISIIDPDRSKDKVRSNIILSSTLQDEYINNNMDEQFKPLMMMKNFRCPKSIEHKFLQGNTEDGVFRDVTPILIPILLNGEHVIPTIASISGESVNLSRSTQRILRDIRSYSLMNINENFKEVDNESTSGNSNDGTNSEDNSTDLKKNIPLDGTLPNNLIIEGESSNDFSNNSYKNILKALSSLPVNSSLGRFLDIQNNTPIMKVIDCPLNYNYTQLNLPKKNILYGGKLGQWDNSSTIFQKMGHIPGAFSTNSNDSSILKLFLFQIYLTEHPYFNSEEKQYTSLKELFNQYCSIYEQKSIEYLVYRIVNLFHSLKEIIVLLNVDFDKDIMDKEFSEIITKRNLATDLLSDEQFEELGNIYHDILTLLPSLQELCYSIHTLTNSLYDSWCQLKDIRNRQTYITTPALVKLKKIHSNLAVKSIKSEGLSKRINTLDTNLAPQSGDITDQDPSTMSSETLWSLFSVELEQLGPNMKVAQAAFNQKLSSISSEEEFKLNESFTQDDFAEKNFHFYEQQGQQWEKDKDQLVNTIKLIHNLGGFIPTYAIQLSDNQPITPDNELPPLELKRRNLLRNLKFKLRVRVNGKVVTMTDYQFLSHPTFSINFQSYFEMKFMSLPREVCVDILSTDRLVSSLFLPIPGTRVVHTAFSHSNLSSFGSSSSGINQYYSHNMAPVYGGFGFTSHLFNKKRTKKKSLNCFFSKSPHLIDEGSRITGSLYCASEFDPFTEDSINDRNNIIYDGIQTDELAKYPFEQQTSAISSNKKRLSKLMGEVNDFTRENDFQDALPNLSVLDTNDPINEAILMMKAKRLQSTDTDIFRLQGLDYGLVFSQTIPENVDDKLNNINSKTVYSTFMNFLRLKESNRLKLLRIRALKPFLFSAPIPLNDKVINQHELYKDILKKELGYGDANYQQDETDETAISAVQSESPNMIKVRNFLQRVRNSRVILSRKSRKRKLATSSVVLEVDVLPSLEIPSLLVDRKRDLKPKIKERIPETIQVEKCDLKIQVVGARNVPLRSTIKSWNENTPQLATNRYLSTTEERVTRDSLLKNGVKQQYQQIKHARQEQKAIQSGAKAASKMQKLRNNKKRKDEEINEDNTGVLSLNSAKVDEKKRICTFVEVKFQDNVIATCTFEGPMPVWKQSLSFPFKPPQNDYSPLSLDQITDEVFFTLFDLIKVEDVSLFEVNEAKKYRRQKYFLGSFSVPFNTVYREGRIEGIFRLDTPLINFGYDEPRIILPMSIGMDILEEKNNPEVLMDAGARYAIPNRPLTAAITSFFDATSSICLDCFPCLESTMNSALELVQKPFQYESVNQLSEFRRDNMYDQEEYLTSGAQTEFSYFISDRQTSFLKVMITLDPLLAVSTKVLDDLTPSHVSKDDRGYAKYATSWLKSLKELNDFTATRNYKAFCTNSSGLSVLICRYLTAQVPPPGFKSRRSLVHLVNMIPFMQDTHTFIGEGDLWCSNSQFWEIGAGDEEEHATMLYNYLRYFLTISHNSSFGLIESENPFINNDSKQQNNDYKDYPSNDYIKFEKIFLVIGKAIPEGDTVYILIRDPHVKIDKNTKGIFDPSNFILINPSNGHLYSATDPFIPLKEIYCLVTPYNIWANIQTVAHPFDINYNVLNTTCWRPFFSRYRLPPPRGGLTTIQSSIKYEPTNIHYCKELEKNIHSSIRNAIRKWRSKLKILTTTFHPEASNVLGDSLVKLEEWKRMGDIMRSIQSNKGTSDQIHKTDGPKIISEIDEINSEIRKRLRKILGTKLLRGFPINIPFTDIENILQKVKTFCIHENKHPNIQFVLSVRVLPLFNNIVSVWIFFGSLEPISDEDLDISNSRPAMPTHGRSRGSSFANYTPMGRQRLNTGFLSDMSGDDSEGH